MKAKITKMTAFILLLGIFASCEDYLEIEAPDNKIVGTNVFLNEETAQSALVGLYNQLASVNFSSGGISSVTVLGALSADILIPIYPNNLEYMEFEQHELLPNNFRNENLWSSAYNIIYLTNALLEGVENNQEISDNIRSRIKGEANFVRAFTYFYLTSLYGEVPLILTTDYRSNSLAERNSEEEVFGQVLNDLQNAIENLDAGYSTGERTVVNEAAALALMARTQLYLENWEDAEMYSTQVLDQTGTYELLEDLDSVFLANSREAIWQISPEGRGYSLTNTQEGSVFIIHPLFYFLAQFKLDPAFVNSFSSEDKRLENWIGFHESTANYFPHKYKIQNSIEDATEFSMVLRLAEQYLIRAEARARQGNLSGAVSDLNVIRERADLSSVSDSITGQEKLLHLIFEERKKELFTEWGHRWLDLKRTGWATEILGDSDTWELTDLLYPLPESEREKNPNLTQNAGY